MNRSRRGPRDDIAGALRYHSEERFRLLVESVKDYAIFMLDCDGTIVSWNAGAQRITGYPAAEAVGTHFARFYTPEARETRWPEQELAAAARTGRTEDEGWRCGRGGERFWAHTVVTALRDAAGALRGYAVTFRDLSDRRRQEEQLAHNEERLRALHSSVRDHAIIMLDANGIVVSWSEGAELIEGYRAEEIIGAHFSRFFPAEAIHRGWPEQELRIAATEGRIEDENWRVRKDGSRFWANVVVTALRDRDARLIGFCKITRDLTERRHQEEALRESQQRFRALEESGRHMQEFLAVLSRELRDPLAPIRHAAALLQRRPPPAAQDVERLSDILDHQVSHLTRILDDLPDVSRIVRGQISVQDSGRGISTQQLGSPFDCFARADRPAAHSDGGLGVQSVAVARSMAAEAGEFAAAAGAAASAPVGRRAPRRATAAPAAPLPSRRVLVVDDNVDSATSLTMLLQAMGLQAQSAHDGVEALEAAERFAPDTVLLDIGLPRLNGYEVARRLRHLTRSPEEDSGRPLLLVALTGWGQEEDRERAREAGFDHHLVKPVDLAQLSRILGGAGGIRAPTSPSA